MPKAKKPTKAATLDDLDSLDDTMMLGDEGDMDLDDGDDADDALDDEADSSLDEDGAEEGEQESADLAGTTKAELTELQSAFQKRAKREDARFLEAVDTEYWLAVCFQTREQKEEFLRKLKLSGLGDKYLDGRRVAKKLGVSISAPGPAWREKKANKRLTDLT